MKIKLLGKNLHEIRPLLGEFGFYECCSNSNDFELIITYGGDGALLGAERDFPGIIKFPLRDESTSDVCEAHNIRSRLQRLAEGKCLLKSLPKVAGFFGNQCVSGINDVFLYSASRTSALRYRVLIDGELYADEVIGDAVGLSSIHGCGAYYRSITHSLFRTGIGLAFSNSTETVDHMVLDSSSKVEIIVTRGPALLSADNMPDEIPVPEGASVILCQSNEAGRVLDIDEFMCRKCRQLRHPHPVWR
jgi:NAD+ kinase